MNQDKKTDKKVLWNRQFIAALIANCLINMCFQIADTSFPVYIKSKASDLAIVGLLSSILLLVSMFCRPFTGILADRTNRARAVVIGLVLLILALIGYVYIPDISGIVAARIVHAIGMCLITTSMGALASESIPQERMGEGMGYFGLGMVFGMSIGPSIGLKILNDYNAQAVFLVCAGFGLICMMIVLFFNGKSSQKIVHSDNNESVWKKKHPSRKLLIIEQKAILPAFLIFMMGIVVSAVTTYLALYASDRGIENIGFFFTIQAVALLLSRLFIGKISDRIGYTAVLIPSLVCLILAMILLYYAKTPFLFGVVGFLYGIGFGNLTSSCQAVSVLLAGTTHSGLAMSTYYLGFDGGKGLGSILNGIICGKIGYPGMYLSCALPLVFAIIVYFSSGGIDKKLKKTRSE